MSLPAIDCVSRGVSNLRANWELAVIHFVQVMVCTLLTLVGVVGIVVLVGASFVFQMDNPGDWARMLERLETLSIAPSLTAIVLTGAATLITIVMLIYSWFQAGIFGILDGGERQAPVAPRVDYRLFRTYRWRHFTGWAGRGVWRFFWYLAWTTLVASLLALVLVLALAFGATRLEGGDGIGAVVMGCLALVPAGVLLMLTNLWIMLGMAVLSHSGVGVVKASTVAFRILLRRLPGAALIGVLFFVAYLGLCLVFWPLTQGMMLAMDGSLAASLLVQFLLTAAQSLVGSLIMIGFFGSLVGLVRTELGARAT